MTEELLLSLPEPEKDSKQLFYEIPSLEERLTEPKPEPKPEPEETFSQPSNLLSQLLKSLSEANLELPSTLPKKLLPLSRASIITIKI